MAVSDYASLDFRRMLKFGVVGVSNTAIDFILYVLLTNTFALWPIISNIASYTVGVANSFVLNRIWTFADREYLDGLAHQLSMFLLSNVSGLLLSTISIWLALFWLDPVPAKAVSILFTLLWNYWFTKNLVFRHQRLSMTTKSPLFRSVVRSSGVVLAAFLSLVIFANAFAAYFVTQEHYVYYWDWAGYWKMYLDISASFVQNPITAIRHVIGSIRSSDYNLLPVLPLVPFEWLFGTSRLTYILAITNVALWPGALIVGLLAQRIFQPNLPKWSLSPLVLATASVLVLSSMWAPVLRGLPDVLGVLVIGMILLLHFAKPLSEQSTAHLVMTGFLLCLLVLVRRWYAFWVVAFFPALAVAQGLDIYQRHGVAWRHYITTTRNAVVIGLTLILALFVIAQPLVLRAISTDYSDIYSAYRHSTSLIEAAWRLQSYFGWSVIICGLIGLAWLTVRKDTRVVGSFLIIQSLIIFGLFTRTQDFGIQHYYLLIPSIALGIAVMIIGIWAQITHRVWRATLVGLVFTALLASSAATFYPGAAIVSNILGSLVPQFRYYPLVRNDLDELEHLSDRLDEVELGQPGDIYVLASSEILNSSILRIYCELGPRRRFSCDHILNTNDVDKRDGFPRQFLHAHYLIVARPTQYHLRAEDQRVIGVLVEEVIESHGIGASFQRLPWEFKLDNGVKVWLFKKVRPLEKTDLDTLAEIFAGYYPDKRHIFRTVAKNEDTDL